VERVDGALRPCERTPPERNGHEAATTSAAGIWVKGCFEPGTAMRLLFAVFAPATTPQCSFVCACLRWSAGRAEAFFSPCLLLACELLRIRVPYLLDTSKRPKSACGIIGIMKSELPIRVGIPFVITMGKIRTFVSLPFLITNPASMLLVAEG